MTPSSEKKSTVTSNLLETIEDSLGIPHGKKDKKDVFAKTKVHLQPESLEVREMMSVNPLDGDWFQSNDFSLFPGFYGFPLQRHEL